MSKSLQGKVAVVTGGSRGIGRALSAALAGAGGKAVSVRADISQPAGAEHLLAESARLCGRPDILVCNAGIAALTPLAQISAADFERIYGINVRSLVFLLKAAATVLNDQGRIITLSSTTALYPLPGAALYASSKAAIRTLTEVAALELGSRGITANCILPGLTETDMTTFLPPQFKQAAAASSPFRRIGVPDDFTGLVLFLASEESRWITGQSIAANGGARR